jgi:hypothetical protein
MARLSLYQQIVINDKKEFEKFNEIKSKKNRFDDIASKTSCEIKVSAALY